MFFFQQFLPLLVLVAMRFMHGRNHALSTIRVRVPRHTRTVPLQNLLESLAYGVAHLFGRRVPTKITTSNLFPTNVFAVQDFLDRGLDSRSFLGKAKRISQHHGRRENLCGRIHDVFTRNVRRGAMHRLIDSMAATAVRDSAQTGTREDSERANDTAGLIRQHIPERVVRVDHTIELARVLDHQHTQTIGQLMLEVDMRELLREDLARDSAPQSARREHVGLVAGPDGRRAAVALAIFAHRRGQGCGNSCTPFDFVATVGPGVVGKILLLDFRPKVRAAAVLAEHDEIGALGDGPFEGRLIYQGARVECAGADVGEGIEVLAQAEEA